MTDLNGIPVTVSEFAVTKEWEFPKDRFVEYGPEDLWWAVKCGFGRWVTRPGVMNVGGVLVVHPSIWEAVKQRYGSP